MFVDTQVRPQGEQVDAIAPSKTNRMKALFLSAAEIVERNGLCKGMRADADGRVCIAGSLAWAECGHPYSTGVLAGLAYTHLTNLLGMGAANWNDRPERTKSEVVAKLREAAQGL